MNFSDHMFVSCFPKEVETKWGLYTKKGHSSRSLLGEPFSEAQDLWINGSVVVMRFERKYLIYLSIIIMIVIEIRVIPEYWIPLFLAPNNVPLFRASTGITYGFLWVLWPILGALLMVLILPRILAPIFLKLKAGVWRTFRNFVVPTAVSELTPKRFAFRMLYISLLNLGVVSMIFTFIEGTVFLPVDMFEAGDIIGPMQIVLASVGGLLTPFLVGLWSVSWTLQDSSVMHYKFPHEDSQELFEIEPVYLKYDTLLKGYAGISSILFVLSILISPTSTVEFVLLTLYTIMHTTLLAVPGLLLHSGRNHTWLQKGLLRLRRLNEEDLRALGDISVTENQGSMSTSNRTEHP